MNPASSEACQALALVLAMPVGELEGDAADVVDADVVDAVEPLNSWLKGKMLTPVSFLH